MKWRRFAGLKGSCRAGRRWTTIAWLEQAALAGALMLVPAVSGADGFDGYGGEVIENGIAIGDYDPGRERSVVVSDGTEGTGMPAEVVAGSVPADDWTRYGFSPAIANRMLGPVCPRWVGQADVLLLWQGNVPATPLLTLQNPPNTVALGGNQLANGLGLGPRTAILLNIDRCYAVEANYFNAGSFNGTREFVAPAGDQLAWAALGGYPIGNIDGGSVMTSGYIQSFELNWRRYNGRSITWIAGFRWIEWNDALALTDSFTTDAEPPDVGIDTLNAAAANDLYGGQIGLDAVLVTLFDVVRFNGIAKAGVYGNPNASAIMAVGGDRVPGATYTATGSSTGFFGEVGVNGTVRLTEHLFWRAGYNFFWIGGVATSLNQLQAIDMTVPSGKLNLDGSVFLQGVNTGIEAVW